jgi:hypothetical protein
MDEALRRLVIQSDVLISLIGRIVFPEDDMKKLIMKRKRKPENYIKAYNLCDGEHSLSDIAVSIGVAPGTLSPILSYWKSIGILYIVENKGKKYKNLYQIREPGRIEIQDLEALEEIDSTIGEAD